ncbi:HTH-type transcriptional repressor cytR [Vibrio nigripulchritudo SO65]|nr:LacI family DNA-binding transcriptional regulator [Vibrio nigripulchritudo]CCN36090.1 HTH-type transcriptional repressor cytR [Vibrio nigripulchritudo AM115]CCN44370.1 HTH-type transcriptional repressor cytR [Vibrio nigripulchritudo FTn2]CCN68107.1 HTH-type transcriptional repressor cytR [Vibrio nigripulchritudo POn4]CCN75381.1 HTH-type transcriptional repressor cytR [Vibrio nigripulchritudo SO65]
MSSPLKPRTNQSRGIPTVKDVARVAGCSTATVSRALTNPDMVSEKTRKKVLHAVDVTGYSLNVAARSLRRSITNTIVVVVPDISNPYFSQVISGIEGIAHKAGKKVLLGDAGHEPERVQSYFDLLPTNQADGIILLTAEVSKRLLHGKTHGSGFPLVMACEYFQGMQLPTVSIDNQQAAEKAMTYLLSLGHKKFGVIQGPMSNPICIDRHQGYLSCLEQAAIPSNPKWVLEGDFSFGSGYSLGRTLLTGADKPTAIFCHNDEMAIGVMKVARELGIRVPEDLSVMGFDDIPFAEYCEPGLTTIHQPRAEIGEAAMKLLMDLIEGKEAVGHYYLNANLIVRSSTAVAKF